MTRIAVDVPVIETARLRLRAPGERDLDAWAAFHAGPRAAFVGGRMNRDQTWRALAAQVGHWALRGYGMFAVEERATGVLAGQVGPWFPQGWPEPEIGWTLLDHAEGRGIAREAAEAARAFAYATLGWTTAISLVDPANARSEALARRLGARPERAYRHETYGTMRIWRHPAPSEVAA